MSISQPHQVWRRIKKDIVDVLGEKWVKVNLTSNLGPNLDELQRQFGRLLDKRDDFSKKLYKVRGKQGVSDALAEGNRFLAAAQKARSQYELCLQIRDTYTRALQMEASRSPGASQLKEAAGRHFQVCFAGPKIMAEGMEADAKFVRDCMANLLQAK